MSMKPIQPSKRPKLIVKLTNQERGFYAALLAQLDPADNGKINGKEAVPFFKSSGLNVDVLKKIWIISSTNNEYLDKNEFYVALRLVAYAQNSISVEPESILKNIACPLPKFTLPPKKNNEKPIEDSNKDSNANNGSNHSNGKNNSDSIEINEYANKNNKIESINNNPTIPNQVFLDDKKDQLQEKKSNIASFISFNSNLNVDSLLDGVPEIPPPKTLQRSESQSNTSDMNFVSDVPFNQQNIFHSTQSNTESLNEINDSQLNIKKAFSTHSPDNSNFNGNHKILTPRQNQKSNTLVGNEKISKMNSKEFDNLNNSTQSTSEFKRKQSQNFAGLSWEISEDRAKKYELYYESFDPQMKGFITNIEAFDIFKQSGLSQDILFNIWFSCDTGARGFLDKAEFIVAIHLIALARANISIQPTLPDVLKDYLIENKKKLISKEQLLEKYKQSMNNSINVGASPTKISNEMNQSNSELITNKSSSELSYSQRNITYNTSTNEFSGPKKIEQEKDVLKLDASSDKSSQIALSNINNTNLTSKAEEISMTMINTANTLKEKNINIINQKTQEVEYLSTMLDNYLKILLSIQNENEYLLEKISDLDKKKEYFCCEIQKAKANIETEIEKQNQLKVKLTQKLNEFEEIKIPNYNIEEHTNNIEKLVEMGFNQANHLIKQKQIPLQPQTNLPSQSKQNINEECSVENEENYMKGQKQTNKIQSPKPSIIPNLAHDFPKSNETVSIITHEKENNVKDGNGQTLDNNLMNETNINTKKNKESDKNSLSKRENTKENKDKDKKSQGISFNNDSFGSFENKKSGVDFMNFDFNSEFNNNEWMDFDNHFGDFGKKNASTDVFSNFAN